MVVLDPFSNAAHFGSLPTNFSTSKTHNYYSDHLQNSQSIISDCDPSFINNFYQTLFQLNGSKLMMSTTYRPETDGQTEVLNRYLQQ